MKNHYKRIEEADDEHDNYKWYINSNQKTSEKKKTD
jgi:hypothetical protein